MRHSTARHATGLATGLATLAAELTVVIPTRGRWSILERTLRGLAEQTLTGFRTIVVVNGFEQTVPAHLAELTGVRFLVKQDEGPGVSRNLGVRLADTELLLFLGDDTIPRADLVARHLARHAAEPEREVAVLGLVDWHPEVARGRVNRWLDWSGSQFDYRQLAREFDPTRPTDAGFGRFYTSNVSLKRALFELAGGFDPDFRFGYEDIDFGWRAARHGMRLRYEPSAVVSHLHRHDLDDLRRRFELVGGAERLMASKHDWFAPWYRERITRHAAAPPVSAVWSWLVELVPESIERLRAPVQARADRWYHQQLAPGFLEGWDRQLDLEELRAYLGSEFDLQALRRHGAVLDEEAAAAGEAGRFYRTSQMYLYDLTVFAISGTKDPYRRQLRSLLRPGARVLDYGCGIGTDGLRLLRDGYRVAFADFANPSTEYLRWRLERRGLAAKVAEVAEVAELAELAEMAELAEVAEVYDIDRGVPGGFDAAYAFDVIEHVEDPFAFLAELEARAQLVVVNLLTPVAGDTALHHRLPIRRILAHAERRGLVRYRRYHAGRSLLIAYGGASAPGSGARLRSGAERRLGPFRRG